MRRQLRGIHAAGAAVLSLLLVQSLRAVPYLPTNDGPESVLAVHIDNHYGDPRTPIYREVFLPALQYASRGFTVLFGPLEEAFGWRVGLQVALATITLATAWGFWAVLTALDRRRLAVGFLGFPLALTWELYMGFFAFAVGSAVGLLVLALAIRITVPRATHRLALGALLLLQAFCHVFSAVITGAAIGVLFVVRAGRGQRLREFGKVALMGAPAFAVLAASVLQHDRMAVIPFAQDTVMLPLAVTSVTFPRIMLPGPWWRALCVLGLVLGALVLGVRATWRRQHSATERAVFLTGATLLFAGFAFPVQIPGWLYVSQRFVPLGTLLCLASLPIERVVRRGWTAGMSVALFTFSAFSLVASSGLHRRLAASYADAIAGISAPVERHGVWLPVTLAPVGGMTMNLFESEVPYLAPLWHLPALYALVEGGLTPYTFALSPASFPIVIRPDGRKPPPVPPRVTYSPEIDSEDFERDAGFRRRVEDELAVYGMFYEGVLLMGARPSDMAQWRSRGYATDWANGSVLIAHFTPCPLDVEVTRADAAHKPLLDVGIGEQTIFRDEALALNIDASGVGHLLLPRSPCGEVWVRPHWDSKRPDGTVQRDFCGNSEADGGIHARLEWTSAHVQCDGAKP